MNVVRIWGGLGNQMFQYAFGRLLERRVGEPTVYDLSWFTRDSDREYGLGAFVCEVHEIAGRKARWMSRDNWFLRLIGLRPKLQRVHETPANIYASSLMETRSSYITGYFQVARYCEENREELLKAFVLRDVPVRVRDFAREMSECESLSLHVRRGDYLKLGEVFCCCDMDYYRRAVRYVRDRVAVSRVYVFSDDIGWCRTNMRLDGDVRFVDSVDATRPELDMYLMSCCRHNIIANSSFSWWGAWLNENVGKVVVAPYAWHVGRRTDIVPVGWARL